MVLIRFYVLLFFIIFGKVQILYAQQYTTYQDSLISLLKTEKDKYQLFNTYFELVDDLYLSEQELEGDFFYKELEKFITKKDIKSGVGCLSILKSYQAFYAKNDIPNAIIYGVEGIETLKSVEDTSILIQQHLVTAMNQVGYFYEYAAMYDKALSTYLEELNFSKRYKYKYGQMTSYNSLFFLHSEYFGDDSLGIKYLGKALKISKEIQDREYQAIVYSNLAMLHIKTSDFRKGNLFLEKAITIRTELKDTVGLAHAYLEEARLNLNTNDIKKARASIKKCLDLIPSKCNWCDAVYKTAAKIAKKEGNFQEAERYFLLAEAIVDEQSNLSGKYAILIHLAMLAKDNQTAKKAANYYTKAFEIKDSLDNQWQIGNVIKIQTQAKVAKIEEQEKALRFEKDILVIKVDSQKKAFLFSVTLLCLALVSGIFIFLQKNKLSKAYKVLVQKNRELTLNPQKETLKSSTSISESVTKKMDIKIHKVIVRNDLTVDLLSKIEIALTVDKVFLDKTLSLASFAQLLDTNTSYLSKIINTYYHKRFNVLINEYRIKEILLFFESGKLEDLTIFALAQEAGFNSKSAFNNAFKEYTGVTPTFYLKSIEHDKLDNKDRLDNM